MSKKLISTGVVHTVPRDLQSILGSQSTLLKTWNGLTPLSRNEWICWVTSVKKDETRLKHLQQLQSDLQKGKRRPCCWPGCPHRKRNTK